MEKEIKELTCKTILVSVDQYPLIFLIFPPRLTANAYVGCLYDCAYCYAKWYCKRDEIKVKINAPEILKKELQNRIAKGKPREPVCFGSISDPYQTAENIGRHDKESHLLSSTHNIGTRRRVSLISKSQKIESRINQIHCKKFG